MEIKEKLETVLELLKRSQVLSEEEKIHFFVVLKRMPEDQLDELIHTLEVEQKCLRGSYPDNLTQEQIDTIAGYVKQMEIVTQKFKTEVRERKEELSVEEDKQAEEELIKQMNSL